MMDRSALAWLLERRLPPERPWELAVLALLTLGPALALAALRPAQLPEFLLLASTAALVLLPLHPVARLAGLAVAMRRGRSLEDLQAAGVPSTTFAAALGLAALTRTLRTACAASAGLAFSALLLPEGLRGTFLGAALLLPLAVTPAAGLAGFGLGLRAGREAAPRARPIPVAPPVRRGLSAVEDANPIAWRESLRRPALPRVLLLLLPLPLGLAAVREGAEAGFWLGLSGVWLGLFTFSAARASAALAREREGRTLEPLRASPMGLEEFREGWLRAATRPLRPVVLATCAAVALGAYRRDLFFPGDAQQFLDVAGRNQALIHTLLLAALATGLTFVLPRAGASLGLWASAGAADRGAASARLIGGLATCLGLVLLGWALLLFPLGILTEHGLAVPRWMFQQYLQIGALLWFPLLSAWAVALGIMLNGRPLRSAWDGEVAAPGLAERVVARLWTPGRLVLLPGVAAAAAALWPTVPGQHDLDAAVFLYLVMAGLGLTAGTAVWLAFGVMISRAWERLAGRGWPVGPTAVLGLVCGGLAGGAAGVLMALVGSATSGATPLLAGSGLGLIVALREPLARALRRDIRPS